MKNITKHTLLILFLLTSIPNRPDDKAIGEAILIALSVMTSGVISILYWDMYHVRPAEIKIKQLVSDNQQTLEQNAQLEAKINALNKENRSLKRQKYNIHPQSNENMETVGHTDEDNTPRLSLPQKFKQWMRPTQVA